MYGSRKVQDSRIKPQKARLAGGLAGIALEGRKRPATADAPPTPAPPSPEPPSDSDGHTSTWLEDPAAEYAQKQREQAKAQLQSITGRMFQVLNDYEDSTEDTAHRGYINELDEQVEGIKNSELKNNIQMMMADYKDMCVEREELLYSLADWFEEGHIDDLLQEAQHRKLSLAANPEGLRESLLEGKRASERLKALNTVMEEGTASDQMKEEKEQLERELMNTMQMVDKISGGQATLPHSPETVGSVVNDSWKFAAVEICNMLHKVRDSGSADLHVLEHKMHELLASMDAQSKTIQQLQSDLMQQKQLVQFSEMTTSKLSSDNFMLKEDLDTLRTQLLQAKKMIASLEAQLQMEKGQQKVAENSKNKAGKVASSAGSAQGADVYKAQISDLTKKSTALEQENQGLKTSIEQLEKDLQATKELYEKEAAGYKLELQAMEDKVENEASKTDKKEGRPATSGKVVIQQPVNESLKEEVRVLVEKEQALLAEMESILKSKEHCERQLTEREHQLGVAEQEIAALRSMLERGKLEVQAVHRENQGLMQIQEKNAAVIQQASYVLDNLQEQEQKLDQLSATLGDTGQQQPMFLTGILQKDSVRDNERSFPREDYILPEVTMTTPANKGMWNIGGSIASNEDDFTFDTPTDKPCAKIETKKAETFEMVIDLIEKLNANQSELATADSKALRKVQAELQGVTKMITGFLEYTTNLVNDEAEVVSSAVDSLITQLPNKERPALNKEEKDQPDNLRNRRTSLRTGHAEKKVLKEKAVHFADQAIEALKAGEQMLSSKIHAQHKNLQTVFHAMAEHKRRQSQAFKFPMPEDVKDLVLEAHAVRSTHAVNERSNQSEQASSVLSSKLERLHHQTRPHRLPPFGHMHPGRLFSNPSIFTQDRLYGMPVQSNLFTTHNYTSTTTYSDMPSMGTNSLQIDTMHHGGKDTGSFSYCGQASRHFEASGHVAHHPLAKHHRKPKLYKPFNLQGRGSPPTFLQVGSCAPPPRTAPPDMRRGVAHGITDGGRIGPAGEMGSGRDHRRTELGGVAGGKMTTFYDLLSHSSTVTQQYRERTHHGLHSIKRPQLFGSK